MPREWKRNGCRKKCLHSHNQEWLLGNQCLKAKTIYGKCTRADRKKKEPKIIHLVPICCSRYCSHLFHHHSCCSCIWSETAPQKCVHIYEVETCKGFNWMYDRCMNESQINRGKRETTIQTKLCCDQWLLRWSFGNGWTYDCCLSNGNMLRHILNTITKMKWDFVFTKTWSLTHFFRFSDRFSLSLSLARACFFVYIARQHRFNWAA